MADDLIAALAAAGTHTADRLRPAVAAAVDRVRALVPAAVADEAVAALRAGLAVAGPAVLAGDDPQALEDATYAAAPGAPLPERALRLAWLALSDALARTGDRPPFGGDGVTETWAFTARSQPWPYVRHGDALGQVSALFGAGVRVVVVRGAGRSSFLAALRRGLLARHGAEAQVPPVLPASRDEIAEPLRPVLSRATLEKGLKDALPQLKLGEDLVGVLGRAGNAAPVALLLDDAHLQSRAILLGLPLFVEPDPDRHALLVLAGPADPRDDGPLSELLADARERDILTEIHLPGFDADFAADLWAARLGTAPDGAAALLVQAVAGAPRDAVSLAVARAWLDALDGLDGAAAASRLQGGFDAEVLLPAHQGARQVLAMAAVEALEGGDFHGISVSKLIKRSEDDVEDLLHDDEFELDGQVVGACSDAVPSEAMRWTSLPDGLHPVFQFADARLPLSLAATLAPEQRADVAGALRDALLNAYGPTAIWQVADRVWRLDVASRRPRQVQQLLVGTQNAPRIEMGFRRMLPVIQSQQPYRLALARLYGTAMEYGAVAAGAGQVQGADQAFQAAAAAAQRLKRPGPAGEALARLAEVRLALAMPRPAVAALEVAETLLQTGGHTASLARLPILRAEARVLEGDLAGAATLLRTGLKRLAETADRGHEALGLMRLGRILYELGDVDAGVTALDEAVRASDAGGDPRASGAARLARAFVHGESGELEAAFRLLNEAAQAFQRVGMPLHVIEMAAADLQRRHGNAADAEKRLRTVADAFKKAGAAVQWAEAWFGVGRCLLDLGRATEGTAALRETVDVRQRSRDRFALVRTHEDLARGFAAQGEVVQALKALHHARRLAERLGMARRLGGIDAELARLAPALSALADLDVGAVAAEAAAAIDALETAWAAAPEAPAQS